MGPILHSMKVGYPPHCWFLGLAPEQIWNLKFDAPLWKFAASHNIFSATQDWAFDWSKAFSPESASFSPCFLTNLLTIPFSCKTCGCWFDARTLVYLRVRGTAPSSFGLARVPYHLPLNSYVPELTPTSTLPRHRIPHACSLLLSPYQTWLSLDCFSEKFLHAAKPHILVPPFHPKCCVLQLLGNPLWPVWKFRGGGE